MVAMRQHEQISLFDVPSSPGRDPTPATAFTLRDYQTAALAHIAHAAASGVRDFYITLPTGCGKAVILAHAAHALASDGRVIIIVHTKELVQQLYQQMIRVFPAHDVGIVMNVQDDPGKRIIVACVATLRTARRLQRVLSGSRERVAALLIDECHHATRTSTYGTIAQQVRSHSPGAVVMGCTATPYREKGSMQDLLPRCVFARDIADMQSAGWLAPLRWHRVALDLDLASMPTSRIGGDLDYAPGVLAVALNSVAMNEHIVRSTAPLIGGRRVLVFGADVSHAQALASTYSAAGITAAAIWGEMATRDRDHTLATWRAGEIQTVTNCQILTEGFDYPAIDAIVIARPTQSLARYMQMIGRGTRLAPGKVDCLIIDCVGNEDVTDSKQIVLPDIMPLVAEQSQEDDPGGHRGICEPRATNERCIYLIDPRHDGRYLWAFHERSGSYFLHANEHTQLIMTRDPSGSGLYRLALYVKAHAGIAGATVPASMQWLAHLAPLPEIRELAQAWLRTHARAWIAARGVPWRGGAPSEKQLSTLQWANRRAYDQAIQENWTKGEVTAALALAFYGRETAPALARLWRGGRA